MNLRIPARLLIASCLVLLGTSSPVSATWTTVGSCSVSALVDAGTGPGCSLPVACPATATAGCDVHARLKVASHLGVADACLQDAAGASSCCGVGHFGPVVGPPVVECVMPWTDAVHLAPGATLAPYVSCAWAGSNAAADAWFTCEIELDS